MLINTQICLVQYTFDNYLGIILVNYHPTVRSTCRAPVLQTTTVDVYYKVLLYQ